MKAGKELLKVRQNFDFSQSKIKFCLKGRDRFTGEHDKMKVLMFDSSRKRRLNGSLPSLMEKRPGALRRSGKGSTSPT